MNTLVYTPQKAAETTVNLATGYQNVGILFGTERSGLTNEELAMADSIIAIPTFNHFSSLNLAQAVNIVGYEIWKRALEIEELSPPDQWLHPKDGERLARRTEIDFLLTRLEDKLLERNYQPESNKRELVFRNIRNIFQRTLVTINEVKTLQGVLTSLINADAKRGGAAASLSAEVDDDRTT